MPVKERLHHVFRRHSGVDDFPALNDCAAFEVEWDRRGERLGRDGEREFDLFLRRHHAVAAQPETRRRIFQGDGDRVGAAVAPQRIDGDGGAAAGARIDAGRHGAQFKIWLRRAEAQPVGIIGTAFVLRVAEKNKICPVRR